MTIENVKIIKSENRCICVATVVSNTWCRFNDIMYRCNSGEWFSNFAISGNIKKMCRREWHKAAKNAGISRKELNIII